MRKLKNIELKRLSTEDFKRIPKQPLVLVLDNIRSLHNVGSVFRTADAFALEGLYLCGITGTPPDREIYKTALGAEDTVDWKYFSSAEEAVKELKASGYRLLALEQVSNSIPLNRLVPDHGRKTAIILGNEINGVSDAVLALCDEAIEIPQFGTKHSLNVAVSAGIAVWHWCKGKE